MAHQKRRRPQAVVVGWLLPLAVAVVVGAGAVGGSATPAQLLTRAPAATPVAVTPAAGGATPIAATTSWRIALFVPRPEEAFWQELTAAVLDEAATLGVTVDVVDLPRPSAPDQRDQVVAAVAAGYDGILLGPVDAIAAVPAVAAASVGGVPVVAVGAAPVAGDIVAVVATDRAADAAAAARFVGEAIDGAGRVLILSGPPEDPTAVERERGLRDGFAEFPGIEVVVENAGWDALLAADIAAERMPPVEAGTPTAGDAELAAVVAATDEMALAAADVAFAAGRAEVLVVGFGGSPDAVAAVADGALAATVAEDPVAIGRVGLSLLVQHLDGEAVGRHAHPQSVIIAIDTAG